ncbi:MAG TPA: iron-sulfur cluster assembly protein, partial [Acidimicrobiales bacterium]|nr:iron-sulfur cluster assembly protein [Acidimicrobiales bacterium]
MSVDDSEVRGAVGAVVDPTLRLPLGEAGMVGAVHARRRRVVVELALPVAGYPAVDELRERVRAAAGAVAGG